MSTPVAAAGPPRILAVIGSPRKRGNTYKAAQAVEEQVRGICGAGFEYLFLAEAGLELCRGCGACLTVGEERCPLKDSLKDIEQRLVSADGVVLASPVYVDNVTWLMKNFMDRLAYTMHRPRFFGQKTLLLSVSAGSDPTPTLRRLDAMRYCGFKIVHSLGVAALAWTPIAETLQAQGEKVRKAAEVFCDALTGGTIPGPSFNDILAFRAKQALFSVMPQHYSADHRYWEERGWLDPRCRYYIPTRVSSAKEAIARLMLGRMKRAFLAQAVQGTDEPRSEE